jgi:threonine dehydrogenase-like Zn-dependent dehydrogenase
MTTKCRAMVFNGDGTYEMRMFDRPRPPAGGAVVKVEAVGMCSSDIEQLKGVKHVPGEVAPVVAGHEMVGRVVALADDARFPVAIGDRVAVDLILRSGLYSGKMLLYGYTMGLDVEGGLWGGYGEYMCIAPGTNLMKLTESLPAEHLTIFEPLANAVNWVGLAGVKAGDSVVVQGPGHVTDRIVLNALTVRGGAGSTEPSMQTAVRLLNEGQVPTEALLGEVLTLDQFEEALLLLKRVHPHREAIRVTIRHS